MKEITPAYYWAAERIVDPDTDKVIQPTHWTHIAQVYGKSPFLQVKTVCLGETGLWDLLGPTASNWIIGPKLRDLTITDDERREYLEAGE